MVQPSRRRVALNSIVAVADASLDLVVIHVHVRPETGRAPADSNRPLVSSQVQRRKAASRPARRGLKAAPPSGSNVTGGA